ncbi:hypothetical protein GOP47_0001658 [Adiantum capillus-veneris]|uniref:Uncharacterized protein n=1 Tax=Adiantum capillus-veneris TaxID=13818 RepID=A0A9D4V8N9_ADICA|nr:hypothetical protein GOP47_0001658 [Adiantum capillus-veneris]
MNTFFPRMIDADSASERAWWSMPRPKPVRKWGVIWVSTSKSCLEMPTHTVCIRAAAFVAGVMMQNQHAISTTIRMELLEGFICRPFVVFICMTH